MSKFDIAASNKNSVFVQKIFKFVFMSSIRNTRCNLIIDMKPCLSVP